MLVKSKKKQCKNLWNGKKERKGKEKWWVISRNKWREEKLYVLKAVAERERCEVSLSSLESEKWKRLKIFITTQIWQKHCFPKEIKTKVRKGKIIFFFSQQQGGFLLLQEQNSLTSYKGNRTRVVFLSCFFFL